MLSLRLVGGTTYVIASVIFLYWRLEVSLHQAKCPRDSFRLSVRDHVESHRLQLSEQETPPDPATAATGGTKEQCGPAAEEGKSGSNQDGLGKLSAGSVAPATDAPSDFMSVLVRWLAAEPEPQRRASGDQASHVERLDEWREQSSMLSSPLTVLSLLNTIAILAFGLKESCLGPLSFMEAHRLVEMSLGYVFVKLIFFVIVLDTVSVEYLEWLILWVCLFGVLKVLERLAKERFQRLTASPSATAMHHARIVGLLLTVLTLDVLMCSFALPHFPELDSSRVLLLAYEPAAVALETIQTLVRYAFHLTEEYPHILAAAGKFAPFLVLSSGVSAAEWRASVLHHLNALFEVSCTLLTLGHCIHLWQLHGYSFHVIDIVLFLNARSLLGKLVRRARSFLRWRATLKNLQSALPDASAEDITSFADDCAICKEPMTSAKRLPCGHLFHLSCLRSWLDQGSAASHSCPSCRHPLKPKTPSTATGGQGQQQGEQGEGVGAARGAQGNADDAGMGAAAEGTSGVVQWLVRWLAEWAERLQARAEQNAWAMAGSGVGAGAGVAAPGPQFGVPFPQPQPRVGAQAEPPGGNQGGRGGDAAGQAGGLALSLSGLRFRGSRGRERAGEEGQGHRPLRRWGDALQQRAGRAPQETPEELESRLVAMAAQVEEIVPHVPFNTILQDLRRTRNAMITVNNLMDAW